MKARLEFDGGQCGVLAIEVVDELGDPCTRLYSMQTLAARGLLSLTDRMILNTLAERVERLALAVKGQP